MDHKELESLSKLCRIDLNEGEMEALAENLQKILKYVEMLQEFDTEDVEPCYNVLGDMNNVEREDVVGETLDTQVFLKNAPSHVGGMIRVPPVFKQG